ncbi:type II toxin-antitoxin system RelE/ParE family toxin [Lonepinella sp. BR2474]|uniref:type II toxin-antitoxin system RelE/ParE family toxin n=1 Tax=Lonepinella sp. BR2474 TaxID=3434548 RepID=UPI003F6E0504
MTIINHIEMTETFAQWLAKLKDPTAKAKITMRIKRAKNGNFGDFKNLKGNLYEMRVDTGKGYRIYYTQDGETLYFLLCGGDKTTQNEDIAHARAMIKDGTR